MGKYNKYKDIKDFLDKGIDLGLDLKDAMDKLEKSHNENRIIRIVLLGAFSDGKTSAIAGLLGKLSENMKIDVAESSDELTVYRPDGLKEGYEIVDTPGLFGSKEKEIDGNNIKYSEITEKYISEAHIVVYITDAVLPLKDSHKDSLKLVLRKFNKLNSTIFVLNKMDEAGYDLTDEVDYNRGVAIKTATLKKRLREVIELTVYEENQLRIVCIAADPKGKGLNYWFNKIDDYKKRSRINLLKQEVTGIIETKDKCELISQKDYAVLQDLMINVSKRITEKSCNLESKLKELSDINTDLENDLSILHQDLKSNKDNIVKKLDELHNRILEDINNASDLQMLHEVIEKEIGIKDKKVDFSILYRKIDRILSDYIDENHNKLVYIADVLVEKISKQNEILNRGVAIMTSKFLKNIHISNADVLKVRDIIRESYKFKPHGAKALAGKLTKVINKVGAALALISEIYEWWKAIKDKEKLAELKDELKKGINEIFNALSDKTTYFNSYVENFAPEYNQIKELLDQRKNELDEMRNYILNLNEYKNKINSFFKLDAEDAEYVEIL